MDAERAVLWQATNFLITCSFFEMKARGSFFATGAEKLRHGAIYKVLAKLGNQMHEDYFLSPINSICSLSKRVLSLGDVAWSSIPTIQWSQNGIYKKFLVVPIELKK